MTVLNVYRSGVLAGRLDMAANEGFYGFTYDMTYLGSNDARPLSASLPLQEKRFSGQQSLPYFEGLLPEGDVRAAIARQLHLPPSSPARLLRALGRDCAGDVAVLEEDDPYQPPAPNSYAPLEGGLERLAHSPGATIAALRNQNRLSLAGGQEKIALYHDPSCDMLAGWYVPLEGSPSSHIVKPQMSDTYPALAANEFVCMRVLEDSGLVPTAHVDLLFPESPLLVIARYDRTRSPEPSSSGLPLLQRVHQEDFCQALAFSTKYEADGGPGFSAMRTLLGRVSANYAEDLRRLLRMALFNYLVGNCDAHAKNFSLVYSAHGGTRLAPAYDVLSTTVYSDGFGAPLSRGMGMKIGRHLNIDRIERQDFEGLRAAFGVSPRLFGEEVDRVSHVSFETFERAAEHLMDDGFARVDELLEHVKAGWTQRRAVLEA